MAFLTASDFPQVGFIILMRTCPFRCLFLAQVCLHGSTIGPVNSKLIWCMTQFCPGHTFSWLIKQIPLHVSCIIGCSQCRCKASLYTTSAVFKQRVTFRKIMMLSPSYVILNLQPYSIFLIDELLNTIHWSCKPNEPLQVFLFIYLFSPD